LSQIVGTYIIPVLPAAAQLVENEPAAADHGFVGPVVVLVDVVGEERGFHVFALGDEIPFHVLAAGVFHVFAASSSLWRVRYTWCRRVPSALKW
jgi:hypothetical protein